MKKFDFIFQKAKKQEKILLMFDYDGTLTPIVAKPELAMLNDKTKNNLESIVKSNFIKIAIISGRQIKTLKELSGINNPEIIMYGVHGGEIYRENTTHVHISDNDIKLLAKFKENIKNNLLNIQGIIIEDKTYSIALHYRNSNIINAEAAKKIFIHYIEEMNLNKKFYVQKGKKVLEVLPQNFNKGKAIENLLNENSGYFPVYFGDDLTDNYAFEKVKKQGGTAIGTGPLYKNSSYVDIWISRNKIEELLDNLKLISAK